MKGRKNERGGSDSDCGSSIPVCGSSNRDRVLHVFDYQKEDEAGRDKGRTKAADKIQHNCWRSIPGHVCNIIRCKGSRKELHYGNYDSHHLCNAGAYGMDRTEEVRGKKNEQS